MKKKCRIIKVILVDGSYYYQIQRRIRFFGYKWIDADWFNMLAPSANTRHSGDLEWLRGHVCYFDGTKQKTEVVETF